MAASMNSLDPQSVPSDFIKEGSDWLVVFNPTVQRPMDVSLAHRFIHEKVVCSVRLSPDSGLLAVGSDGVLIVYDIAVGQKLTFPLEGDPDRSESTAGPGNAQRNYVRAVSFSPDGKWLVSGSEDKLIRVWSLAQKQLVQVLGAHQGEVYAVEFSPDGTLLVSASGDRTILVWNARAIGTEAIDHGVRRLVPADDPDKSQVAFTCLAVSSAGVLSSRRGYVAGGSLDGAIRIWDLDGEQEDGLMVERLRGHADSVYSVKFLEGFGGSLGLLSGSLDKTLKKWDLKFDGDVRRGDGGAGERGSTCIKTLQGHKEYVLATAIVRDGQSWRAASASRDGTVRLWDLKNCTVQFSIQGHKNTVTCVDVSADGKLLVSGSGDAEVRIWKYSIV